MNSELPNRKSPRLADYDYSSPGAYFVTICTEGKRPLLSQIVGEGLAPPAVRLSRFGVVADGQINAISSRFPIVRVDKYVVMPNHIHMILVIEDSGGASPSPTIPHVVGAFKSVVTRLCGCGPFLFQRSFHDHIIRGEKDYLKIWEYIDTNPAKWEEDCFYPEQ